MAADGDELVRHPVAVGDGAGLVEQQGGHVAGGLDGPAGHGQHVALHQAVHPGDADGAEQRADGRRRQAHEQGDQDRDRLVGMDVDGERLQGGDGEDEDDRQPDEQDVERDLVGRLLPVGPLDEGDHPVEERLARLRRDPHDDAVGEDPGASGDGRAVAAGFADHRRRLAGDGRLVDRGDALDDVTVAGDHLAGLDDDQVADLQLRRRNIDDGAVVEADVGDRLRAGLAQGVGLGLAPTFGDRLGEVGEQHREPQPGGHQADEHVVGRRRLGHVPEEQDGGPRRADLDDEHDRVAGLGAGVQLDERVPDGPAHDRRLEQPRARLGRRGPARGSRETCGWRRVSVVVIDAP